MLTVEMTEKDKADLVRFTSEELGYEVSAEEAMTRLVLAAERAKQDGLMLDYTDLDLRTDVEIGIADTEKALGFTS